MGKKKTSKKQRPSSMTEAPIVRVKDTRDLERNNASGTLRNKDFIAKALFQSLLEGDVKSYIEILAAHIRSWNLSHLSKKSKVPLRTIHSALAKNANPSLKTLAKIIHGMSEMEAEAESA